MSGPESAAYSSYGQVKTQKKPVSCLLVGEIKDKELCQSSRYIDSKCSWMLSPTFIGFPFFYIGSSVQIPLISRLAFAVVNELSCRHGHVHQPRN